MDRDSAIPKIRGTFPGPNARAWVRHHMSRSPKSTYFYRVVRDRLAPASGPFFTDVDGNVLLDFVSQVASAPFGYNDPEMIEFIRSLPIEDPDRYAGTDFICAAGKRPGKSSIPTPADLHEKIAKISRQLGMDCSYFSNSGAEAVENAMKTGTAGYSEAWLRNIRDVYRLRHEELDNIEDVGNRYRRPL